MKKAISLFLLLVLVLFTVSCSESQDEASLPSTDRPFSSVVDITYKDLVYTADLTYRNSAGATLEITSPQNIEGLVFNLSGNDLTAKYEGIDFPLDDVDGKTGTAAGMIFSAIANASTSSDVKIDNGANEFFVSGKVYSYEYEMVFDKLSGAIKSFSVPSQGLNVIFRNFSFLG